MANYAPSEKIEQAKKLRNLGYSTRFISRQTGLHRETVLAYTGKIGRSDSMHIYHALRKGNELPNVQVIVGEVRRRKRRFIPIGSEEVISGECLAPEVVSDECLVPELKTKNSKLQTQKYRFDRRTKLTASEEDELWLAYKVDNDISARDLIIRCHIHYVVTIAKIISKKTSVSLDELITEGNYGLLIALNKFEPERNLRFITYASYWIKASITSYVQKMRTITNKKLVKTRFIFKIRREKTKAENLFGNDTEAIESYLSEKLSVSIEKVRDILIRSDAYDISLDTKVYDDGEKTLIDTLVSEEPSVDVLLENCSQSIEDEDDVSFALSQLQPRERLIAEQRLMTDDPPTLAEVGRKLGISRERARQLEARTIQKLRQHIWGRNAEKHQSP